MKNFTGFQQIENNVEVRPKLVAQPSSAASSSTVPVLVFVEWRPDAAKTRSRDARATEAVSKPARHNFPPRFRIYFCGSFAILSAPLQ